MTALSTLVTSFPTMAKVARMMTKKMPKKTVVFMHSIGLDIIELPTGYPAFGRLGEWFGPARFGVRPDMITFAKGVTSGYIPLGGVVIDGRLAAPFWDHAGHTFRHGQTYAGHPTACAVAMANMDIIEREGLLARGLELDQEIALALADPGLKATFASWNIALTAGTPEAFGAHMTQEYARWKDIAATTDLKIE